MNYVYFGPAPSAEDCAQVGSSDFRKRARIELETWRGQLAREFPGIEFLVQWNNHDFGSYGEIVAEATEAAFAAERDCPEVWDEQSIAELVDAGIMAKPVTAEDFRNVQVPVSEPDDDGWVADYVWSDDLTRPVWEGPSLSLGFWHSPEGDATARALGLDVTPAETTIEPQTSDAGNDDEPDAVEVDWCAIDTATWLARRVGIPRPDIAELFDEYEEWYRDQIDQYANLDTIRDEFVKLRGWDEDWKVFTGNHESCLTREIALQLYNCSRVSDETEWIIGIEYAEGWWRAGAIEWFECQGWEDFYDFAKYYIHLEEPVPEIDPRQEVLPMDLPEREPERIFVEVEGGSIIYTDSNTDRDLETAELKAILNGEFLPRDDGRYELLTGEYRGWFVSFQANEPC